MRPMMTVVGIPFVGFVLVAAGVPACSWVREGGGAICDVAADASVGVGVGDGGSAGGCVPAPPGIVSWWPGDGNADDIVGHNNGTLVGGASFATGRVGQAFSLDGLDDFVNVGNGRTLQISSGDFTVDAWVLFRTLNGDMSIVDKMSAKGVNLDGWRLLKQDDNRFWFCFGGVNENHCIDPAFTVFSATLVTANTWFHVAAVKRNGSFAIYVDGVLEDSRSPVPAFADENATDLLIGSYALEGAYLDGLVDEVEIFNRALTGAEIKIRSDLNAFVASSQRGPTPPEVVSPE